LLEAVRTYRPARPDLALPFLYPLVATYLLTGGRRLEVLGLEVSDISFERRTVTFRPNDWRRLKTRTSQRTVPLWPQLSEILTAYLSARTADEVLNGQPTRRLLFPGVGEAGETMVTDFGRYWTPRQAGRGGKRERCGPKRSGTPTARPGCNRSTVGRR
jgi:integrase